MCLKASESLQNSEQSEGQDPGEQVKPGKGAGIWGDPSPLEIHEGHSAKG